MNIRSFTSSPPSLSLLSLSPASVVSPSHPPSHHRHSLHGEAHLPSSPSSCTVCPLIPYNTLRSSPPPLSIGTPVYFYFFHLISSHTLILCFNSQFHRSPSHTPTTQGTFLLEQTTHIKKNNNPQITISIHFSFFPPTPLCYFYSHSRACSTVLNTLFLYLLYLFNFQPRFIYKAPANKQPLYIVRYNIIS